MINEEISISEEVYQKALEFEDEDNFFGEDLLGFDMLDTQQEVSVENLTALHAISRRTGVNPFTMTSGV